MARLRELAVAELLPTLTQPVLGICLGMQLLFERSEEGDTECLGILPATVRRLQPAHRAAGAAHGLESARIACARIRCSRASRTTTTFISYTATPHRSRT